MFLRCVVFLLFAFSLPLAAEPPKEQTLDLLQTSIVQKLQELRTQLAVMEAELTLLQKTSSEEREKLELQLESLKTSYSNTLNQLNSCYTTIDGYRNILQQKDTELTSLTKFSAVLIVILIISILLKIGVYIAMLKGVRLPRWLEILL